MFDFGEALGPMNNAEFPPEELAMSLGESVASSGEAIELSGEDLRRFHYRFKVALSNSKTQMDQIHREAERDRKIYKTVPRKPLYEGGPDITAPLSADYTDGLRAHLKDAIEQRPLAAFTPEGIGRAAEEATEIAPIYEAALERVINRGGSRQRIANDISDEAVIVGTAIAKLGLADYGDEIFPQISRLIRLENFFVDRVATDSLRDVFCAYRYKERFYNLQDDAAKGLLDPATVEGLRTHHSSSEQQIPEEEEKFFHENNSYEQENALLTLYCGYMHFKAAGSGSSELYECVYHEGTHAILALRLNPAREAYEEPPLELVRVGRQPGYLFGRGVVRRLENEQKIADRGINNHLAVNDMAAAPPVQYNVNNPIAAKLAQDRVLEPAMWIPNYGPPDRNDILPIQIPNNGLSFGEYDLALSMAQRRTYTDEAIGQTNNTRKTLGQFRTEVAKGTLKLRLDLNDLAYDMASLLRKLWAMVLAYKVDPAGIITVEPLGKLLANREMTEREVAAAVVEAASQLLVAGDLDIEDINDLTMRWPEMLTNGRAPSAKRNDLTLSLSGTKIIADKIGELDTEMQLMPIMLNLIQGAEMDTYINYWGRSILRKAGLTDIEKRWPQDPGTILENPAERFALVNQLNQLVNSYSTAF